MKKKYEKSIRITPKKKRTNLGDMLLTIVLMPFIIAGAIAMMMLSYMLVPLFIVLILGSIIYFTIKVNKNQY